GLLGALQRALPQVEPHEVRLRLGKRPALVPQALDEARTVRHEVLDALQELLARRERRERGALRDVGDAERRRDGADPCRGATAYPTRRPARPYALENVRSSTTFGRCAYTARPSGASGSRTNSRYASSSTTSTSDGTASRNVSSSSRWTTGPVGLLGEHSMTT